MDIVLKNVDRAQLALPKINRMKGIFIFILVLAGLMVFTNPPLEDHKAALKTEYTGMIDDELDNSGLGKLKNISKGIGGMVIDGIIDSRVSRANYLLFSLTQVQRNDKKEIVAVGVLGNVFFLGDLEESKEKFLESLER